MRVEHSSLQAAAGAREYPLCASTTVSLHLSDMSRYERLKRNRSFSCSKKLERVVPEAYQ